MEVAYVHADPPKYLVGQLKKLKFPKANGIAVTQKYGLKL